MPLIALLYHIRRGAHQLSAADAYKAVIIDLKFEPEVLGFRVFITVAIYGWAALLGAERRTEVQGVLGLKAPIGYGFTMRSRRRKRTGGLKTADEDFDKLFFVNAVYTEAATELLTEREAVRLNYTRCAQTFRSRMN